MMPAEGLRLICPSVLLAGQLRLPLPLLEQARLALTRPIEFLPLLKTGLCRCLSQAVYVWLVQSSLNGGQGVDVIFIGVVVMDCRHPDHGCHDTLGMH